ncbi:MAG: hypothetical protein HY849_04715 [Nitrosomonadales bacterium]|nr:hypothetical protein [Nitrosomonadales bacterium]
MSGSQVISVQADMRVAHVKPRSGGRSQNYMPPEAKDALDKAQKTQSAASAVSAAPAAK